MSSNEFEHETVDLLKEKLLEQALDFNTRGESQFVIAGHRSCLMDAETNNYVTKVITPQTTVHFQFRQNVHTLMQN